MMFFAPSFDVFDNGTKPGDGNADTATDYFFDPTLPYSGYTISIRGNEYAIFTNGANNYFIPYFNAVDDLPLKTKPFSRKSGNLRRTLRTCTVKS